MIMASYKVFFLLFISCNVCYELYPFHQSEAASVPPANATGSRGKGGISSRTIVAIVVLISVAVLIFIVAICCLSKRIWRKCCFDDPHGKPDLCFVWLIFGCSFVFTLSHHAEELFAHLAAAGCITLDLLQYDFSTIEAATNKFSSDNLIDPSRCGDVYKGTLANGQDIAVKRFSLGYRRGAQELKNEVVVLANIQHINIVKLLGFSVQGEEKMLVYEYLPNRSLDYSLFDLQKQRQLDWTTRYKIIKGIARGIEYLHEDAPFKIIHRDIKPSNILLDDFLNPKIKDFGIARIFAKSQSQESINEIRGTFGYMAPENALRGEISVKSDVYSFGILLIEIISGKRIISFDEWEGSKNLLSYDWKLWSDGEPLELLDATIRESCDPNEVMRCFHIALLCVQEDPADRPFITSVILMLDTYPLTLPTPSQTAFFAQEDEMSVNEMSDDEVIPR